MCEAIEKKKEGYEKERLKLELCSKSDSTLVDAILVSFGMGFSKDIELGELDIASLFNLLKLVLLNFPSPLFTFNLALKYSQLTSKCKIDNLCIDLLNDLPDDNFNSVKKVISCLHFCTYDDVFLVETYSKFFASCFMRNKSDSKALRNTDKILFFIISNYDKLQVFQSFRNRDMHEEKTESLLSQSLPIKIKKNSIFDENNSFSFHHSAFRLKLDKDTHFYPIILQFVFPYLSFGEILVGFFFFYRIYIFTIFRIADLLTRCGYKFLRFPKFM